MLKSLKTDLNTVLEKDPAARNRLEVFLTYSGFHAVRMYRFAHFLYLHNYKLCARIISQLARFITGIEIPPAAKIGSGVFIDHGAGVVIGETAEVGDDCTIYQGVTLGGTGKDKGKRHPTLREGVMVAAGAKILGPFTVGKHAKIGAGSVVLKEVPDNATVVGVPGRVVRIKGERVEDLDQDLPDPIKDELTRLQDEVKRLKEIVEKSEKVEKSEDERKRKNK